MDYKYIERLMERYFKAETSLEEESILRTFFCQENIPAEMQQWRALFTADANEQLGDDFDARILAMIENEQTASKETKVVKAQEVKLTQRMMPLFKAAAVIAIIITLGGALQAPWDKCTERACQRLYQLPDRHCRCGQSHTSREHHRQGCGQHTSADSQPIERLTNFSMLSLYFNHV